MASNPQPAPGSARCFGIDAEDGRSAVLVERLGAESRAAEWFPLDVASRMMRSPEVELLLLFERHRTACADTDAQAAHARELARSAPWKPC
jgi:hypothetical protein